MTSDELRILGEKLYGPRWQSAMARDIPVSRRTIRRWLTGNKPIRLVNEHRIRQLEIEFDYQASQATSTS